MSTKNFITNEFEGIVDPKFIFSEYNEEWLDRLIKKMADITKKYIKIIYIKKIKMNQNIFILCLF